MSLRHVLRRCPGIHQQYSTVTSLGKHSIDDRRNSQINRSVNVTNCFKPYPACIHTGQRLDGIKPPSISPQEGIFKRMLKFMGWTKTPKSVLAASGYLLYIKVADEVNYADFYEVCNMPDTYASWFIVMELHTWLLATRLMSEGDEGRQVRNNLIKAMWEDVDTRSKKLEGALSAARKFQISELGKEFQTSLISYDEGILSSDRVLAGALWRRFLQPEPGRTLTQDELARYIYALELLVAFVRCQYYNLHKLSREDVMLRRKFVWTPFNKQLLNLGPMPAV